MYDFSTSEAALPKVDVSVSSGILATNKFARNASGNKREIDPKRQPFALDFKL